MAKHLKEILKKLPMFTIPSIGEVSAKVTLATKQDVDKVVDIAHRAFQSWSSTPALQRARILI